MNDWVNNREAGDLRRHGAHYDVTVMCKSWPDCVIIAVRAEGLAPSGARTSAGTAQTKSVPHIYPVMAFEAWLGNDTITIISLIFT